MTRWASQRGGTVAELHCGNVTAHSLPSQLSPTVFQPTPSLLCLPGTSDKFFSILASADATVPPVLHSIFALFRLSFSSPATHFPLFLYPRTSYLPCVLPSLPSSPSSPLWMPPFLPYCARSLTSFPRPFHPMLLITRSFSYSVIPLSQDEFFSFLASVDASAIRIVSLPEGYVAFPRVPLLRVEGPLLVRV